MDSILATLKETPLFDGLERAYLESIASIAGRRSCRKGEIIFNEGEDGDRFYVVESGTVKIFKSSFAGKEQILHIYGPGKPFGEVPVFIGKNFPASAVALSNCTLIFFPRKEFISVVTGNPSIALNMLAILSMRLHRFTVMVENLALKEVPARLASYLMVLAEEQSPSEGSAEGVEGKDKKNVMSGGRIQQKDQLMKGQFMKGQFMKGQFMKGQLMKGQLMKDQLIKEQLIKKQIMKTQIMVTLPVSKNQLAGLLGTTPETVSRVFGKFTTDQIIEVDRNVITILDMDLLSEAAMQ